MNASYSTAINRIQWFTVVWMSLEVAVATFAAIRARSVALAEFGGDSAIELLSAATVLWRFRSSRLKAETTATRITGSLLLALAGFVVAGSFYVLVSKGAKPQPSYLGIFLLVVAAVVMPWLGRRKRGLAAETGSSALRADSAQSSICGYLAWIALCGLLLNAVAHLQWADPVAALCLLPLVIKEAKEAFEGHTCDCN